jgi:small subunit ribosomal protein S6
MRLQDTELFIKRGMMKQQKQQLYEGMYVLSAHLSDDARGKAIEKIKEQITSRGGKILKVHDQGRRRLAYEINRHREGYYFLIYFEVETKYIEELWEEYRRNEDLLRFLTVKAEKVLEELKFKQLPEL